MENRQYCEEDEQHTCSWYNMEYQDTESALVKQLFVITDDSAVVLC